MKTLIRILVAIFFAPFLLLGVLIGVVRVLFVVTFGMAWEQGDRLYGELLMKLDSFLKNIK